MNNSPTPTKAESRRSTYPGEVGGQVSSTGNCPLDNDLPAWGKVLTDEVRTRNVARVVVRRFGERTSICFDLRDGSKYDRPTRVEMAVAWMRKTGRLSRGEFFIGCEIAGGSASLHDKAIKRLARMGLIEKQAGVWVWAE